jgi:hypothetical protein
MIMMVGNNYNGQSKSTKVSTSRKSYDYKEETSTCRLAFEDS